MKHSLLAISCLGLFVAITPTVQAGWKEVSAKIPSPDVDTQRIFENKPLWSVHGASTSTSMGSAGFGNAVLEVVDEAGAAQEMLKVTKLISSSATATLTRSWKYYPTANKPVGEVEFNGEAWADYTAKITGDGLVKGMVLSKIVGNFDGQTVSAQSGFELPELWAGSSDEDDVSTGWVIRCPVLNFSVSQTATIKPTAGASIGTASGEISHGGKAKLEFNAWSVDSHYLISLSQCPN